MAELTVPSLDFSSLGQLPQLYRQGQADALRRQTLASLGQGGQADASALLRSGDLSLAQLGINMQNRESDLARQARQDAFQREESARAQRNADRSFGLQARAAARADDDTPDGFYKTPSGSYAPLPGGPQDPAYLGQRAAAVVKPEIPSGFQRDSSGGLAPIPGGPADPAYLRQKGDKQNAPSGYVWNDPNNPSAGMTAIPGGPGEKVDAEVAGRLGLAKSFLGQLPEIKRRIDAGEATGPIDGLMGKAGIGAQGELRRQIDSGAEALLRMLTGAGMNKEEAGEYTRRYKMHPLDNAATLKSKMEQLERELNSVGETVGKGRGGWQSPSKEPAKQDSKGFRAPPKIGELRDGYRYKGGNPGDPANWAKAKDAAAPSFDSRFDSAFNAGNGS